MMHITKIFHFEMAHAINDYSGACKNIHGHSYELHVTITTEKPTDGYLPSPGFIFNFKELKRIVSSAVIETLDHKLIVSRSFIEKNSGIELQENLAVWEAEPSAENLLIYIRDIMKNKLPGGVILASLKLYETKDSYAEWINRKI